LAKKRTLRGWLKTVVPEPKTAVCDHEFRIAKRLFDHLIWREWLAEIIGHFVAWSIG
jgi:hypothetical protein